MKSCLIFLTLFAGFQAMPKNAFQREETFPQRIQMKDLEATCDERYGLKALVDSWVSIEDSGCDYDRSDLLADQFINMQDEHMFHCACWSFAVEQYWDYPALWIVNEEHADNMENYVEYTDYTEAEYAGK